MYCVKIMKPCEVGHSKTLPAPRAAANRREEEEGGLKDGQTKGATAFHSRALSLPLPFSGSRAYERVLNVCVCGVCLCEWSVSVDCVQPQSRCWQLLGPLPLHNPRRREGGRKYCGNRLSCRQWLRCNNCYTAKSERERETERGKEVRGPTSLGSQLVYARKTYK